MAAATLEIKNRIGGLQGSNADTAVQIEEISGVINEVNEMAASTAAAAEERAATSQEIAYKVTQASHGIQDVNEDVNQSSTVAGTISGDITPVNASVKQIANSSSQVNRSSDERAALDGSTSDLHSPSESVIFSTMAGGRTRGNGLIECRPAGDRVSSNACTGRPSLPARPVASGMRPPEAGDACIETGSARQPSTVGPPIGS